MHHIIILTAGESPKELSKIVPAAMEIGVLGMDIANLPKLLYGNSFRSSTLDATLCFTLIVSIGYPRPVFGLQLALNRGDGSGLR
jgi:hypothetical protein